MTDPKFNRLTLVAAERGGRSGPRRSQISARRFMDFHVDGRSLRHMVPDSNDTVTPLCREWLLASVADAVRGLRGDARPAEPGLAADEVELLICAECGDLDCGALIATVQVAERVVIWRGFRWVQAGEPESVPVTLEGTPFIFNRQAYMRALVAADHMIDELKGASPRRS